MARLHHEASVQEQVYVLVGVWLEAMIYGVYIVMFWGFIVVTLRMRKANAKFSKVFFLSALSMFTMISIYICINLSRALQAYALNAELPTPVSYYHDTSRWENYSFAVFVTLLVWHADALVIYRCFIIWGRSYRIIIVPCALLLLSFVINTIGLISSRHPIAIPPKVINAFFQMIYPVNITQSLLTTGLITWRIMAQHHMNVSVGSIQVSYASIDLLHIVRIVLESAMIFTTQQVVLLILYELNHPAQVILHATLVPSIGIVFILMTLRTHFAKTDSEARWTGVLGSSNREQETQSGTAHRSRLSIHSARVPPVPAISLTRRPIDEMDYPMHVIGHKMRREEEDSEPDFLDMSTKNDGQGL